MALVKYIWKTSQMIVMLTLNKALILVLRELVRSFWGIKSPSLFSHM